jgi:hypothetical protein
MTSYIYNMVDTWALSGGPYTSIKMNATDNDAASASLLMDLQVGSVSQFNVSKAGVVNVRGNILPSADNGINIGSNALRINTLTAATAFRLTSAGAFDWSDTFLTRKAAANFRFGAADAAAPVAQTLSVQSVVAGTTNTAGAALTITGSQGTGSGVGGAIIFQVAVAGAAPTVQNPLVTAWSISGAGNILAGTDNTYDIGASGATRPRNVYVAGEAIVGDNTGNNGKLTIGIGLNRGLYFGNRGLIGAVADGVFALQNNATTDFGRLQFGGTSASFPAIKRSSTTLQARLADDSAFASVQGKLTTDTAYTAGAIVVTGYLTLYDSTGTAYRVPCVV